MLNKDKARLDELLTIKDKEIQLSNKRKLEYVDKIAILEKQYDTVKKETLLQAEDAYKK